ncbi:uncharacterized protein TRUGW13939_08808 [Talaromyces rugulosus]|uniref:Uncharacterized protein n=1 Tax=Talaromyces rugulosus TaxID=121627 RepID=A0A7H8R625_TALRU|nr:uncharacterized protein TRUGW13939_08808 [Talaromyces rugulosus]QKX61656.1 hypothetical protein TRUGW13939_08808 [Talaromyces rugulosus]
MEPGDSVSPRHMSDSMRQEKRLAKIEKRLADAEQTLQSLVPVSQRSAPPPPNNTNGGPSFGSNDDRAVRLSEPCESDTYSDSQRTSHDPRRLMTFAGPAGPSQTTSPMAGDTAPAQHSATTHEYHFDQCLSCGNKLDCYTYPVEKDYGSGQTGDLRHLFNVLGP